MPKPKKNNHSIKDRNAFNKFFKVKSEINLPRELICPITDFFDILETRKTHRTFKMMSLKDISSLFWFSQRYTAKYDDLTNRVKTPIPTAGALASVQTLLITPSNDVWLYNPFNHRINVIESEVNSIKYIRKSASEFFEIGDGFILLFFSSRSFISEYYENPDSLVLREAGVLLGNLALIAEAFKLSFCPLGTTAKDWFNHLLDTSEQTIIPAGAAVVGRR